LFGYYFGETLMNTILKYLCFSSITLCSTLLHAELLFHDNFESADMSQTNSQGFFWEANNRTSVVYGDGEKSEAVWNNGPVSNVQELDWKAWEGNHSLRFRWAAGENWAEQRFNLGMAQKEVWFSYFIRVPHNYRHCTSCTRRNNKFFSLWMDNYEVKGIGSTFWLSMEDAGNGDTDLAFSYSQGNNTGSGSFQQHAPFINIATDRGRWMQIVIHLKTESATGTNDGTVETWRRWSDDTTFTALHSSTTVGFNISESGPQGFIKGYLFGWANGPYAENTDWLMDEVKISTTSLLEEGPVSAKPMPANNLAIRINQ
jgi:hypothetical protein